MHRFYAPDLNPAQSIVALPPEEAQHLSRVLRLAPGTIVAVFDGSGLEFSARVGSAERGRVSLELLEPRQPAQEPAVPITLAQAVLKGDKMDDVVRDAVMLGVAKILPVVSDRAETSLASLRKGRRVERWRRIAVASAKQSGRAVVPPVGEPVSLSALVSQPVRLPGRGGSLDPPAAPQPALKLALVEPSQSGGQPIEALRAGRPPAAALVLVGPEGGWSAAEIAQMVAGAFRLVTLGSRTLRADAVPVAAVTLLQFIWGDL